MTWTIAVVFAVTLALGPCASSEAARVIAGTPSGLLQSPFGATSARRFDRLLAGLARAKKVARVSLDARLTVPAETPLDPARDGLTLTLTLSNGGAATSVFSAAAFRADRRHTRFRLAPHAAGGFTQLVLVTGRQGTELHGKGRLATLDPTGATAFTVRLSSGAARYVSSAACTSRARGRKLVCRA